MRIVCFNGNKIGVVGREETVVDVSDLCEGIGDWPPVSMIKMISRFEAMRPQLEKRVNEGKGVPIAQVRLEAPITWPNKLIAIPVNYHAHAVEMSSPAISSVAGFFLKSNSSLSGPQDDIVLPDLPTREIHHEAELGVIIGKGGRHIGKQDAHKHIFGFCCLLDITVRGKQERVMRKSYDTFCPTGPWIITLDEVPDYANLDIRLDVSGEPRQAANTKSMILGTDEIIEMCSSAMTLYPGDVIATGTCEGVGPIRDGDSVNITIAKVGSMSVKVRQGKGGRNVAIPE